jgi:hypothetical protein
MESYSRNYLRYTDIVHGGLMNLQMGHEPQQTGAWQKMTGPFL